MTSVLVTMSRWNNGGWCGGEVRQNFSSHFGVENFGRACCHEQRKKGASFQIFAPHGLRHRLEPLSLFRMGRGERGARLTGQTGCMPVDPGTLQLTLMAHATLGRRIRWVCTSTRRAGCKPTLAIPLCNFLEGHWNTRKPMNAFMVKNAWRSATNRKALSAVIDQSRTSGPPGFREL